MYSVNHTTTMATNPGFSEDQEPNTMTRPAGSGFGGEYEEISRMERREDAGTGRGSSGTRGRSSKDNTRYGDLSSVA